MIKYTTTAIYSVCVLFLLLLRCWLVWAVDDVALSSQTACWTRMASLRREYQQNWNGACMEHLRPIYDPDLYVIWLIKSVLREDRNFDGITQPRAPLATHLSVCFIENFVLSLYCDRLLLLGLLKFSQMHLCTTVLLTPESYHCSDRNADEGLSSGVTWAHDFVFLHRDISYLRLPSQILMCILC